MTPYDRAWQRAKATGKPALYFQQGAWFVSGYHTGRLDDYEDACTWAYGT